MTTVFIMKKFVTVWCFAVLFNQVLTSPIFYDIREDLDTSPPNELSEDDTIFLVNQDGIYEIDSDILSSFGNENKYDDYDLSTSQTERFLDALELNAKINSGDIMSEYYNGKPQLGAGVEFANEYTTDDMPGTEPFHFEETKSYLKYLQEIERDSKEKRQKAIYNNILEQELDDPSASRYKRSTSAVNKIAKLLNDAGKGKLRHNSIKISQSTPSNKVIKFINHIKNSKLAKGFNKPSKSNSLIHDVTNSALRNSGNRFKRSASVAKVVKLFDDVNSKLRENSNKRSKRSLSSVDKVAKLIDDVNFKLRENSNKRSKRSLASVDKVAKLFDDVNFKLRENSNKRMKRSISSVDKVVKLVNDVNMKLRENSEKRFKRSLSSIDKVKALIHDIGSRNVNKDLKKGVIMNNGADCGGMGRRGGGGGGDPDEAAGSGDGASPNPESEDATNLRLTNMKRYNKRKQRKVDV